MSTSSHKRFEDGLNKLIDEQGVTTRVASDVLYFRTQPQWSQKLEDKFIEKSRGGDIPDVTQFGNNQK